MGEKLKKLRLDKKILLFTVIGAFIGIALFAGTATTLEATDSGEFCSTCHIMERAYESFASTNHSVLKCNDCHLPHDNTVTKLTFKAKAGMSHMYMNTLGANKVPDVIHAKEKSTEVALQNCIRCHEPSLENVSAHEGASGTCIDCHRQVPHGGGDFRPADWFEPGKFYFADPNK